MKQWMDELFQQFIKTHHSRILCRGWIWPRQNVCYV